MKISCWKYLIREEFYISVILYNCMDNCRELVLVKNYKSSGNTVLRLWSGIYTFLNPWSRKGKYLITSRVMLYSIPNELSFVQLINIWYYNEIIHSFDKEAESLGLKEGFWVWSSARRTGDDTASWTIWVITDL